MARRITTIRLEEEMLDQLKARAEADKRTMQAVIELALSAYLGPPEPKPEPKPQLKRRAKGSEEFRAVMGLRTKKR